MAVAVADAHALIWFAKGPLRKLGPRGRALLEGAAEGRATVYVPTVTLVEIAEALRRGAVRYDGGFTRWSAELFARDGFVAVDLTLDIVVAAEALYSIPGRGDRLIAATALHLDCPLITRYAAIGRAAHIETIW
jgi:PIN domain nuclease of toxin-antitoxin system